MDQKIDEHFGFEARDDVEGVLTTLAPDVTHDIVGFPAGPTHGRENARPFYETLFADLEEGKVTCTRRLPRRALAARKRGTRLVIVDGAEVLIAYLVTDNMDLPPPELFPAA